jgi:glutaredoxin-related protein
MVTIYSNGCPKCNLLKGQLDKAKVKYKTTDEFQKLIDNGFTSLPVMELEDGKLLGYNEAIMKILKGEL